MEKLSGLSHLFVTVLLFNVAAVMILPALTDVTLAALCPGLDECSLAIYLTGFQQAIVGVGTALILPLIGNLSDVYGRKALLTFPMTVSIIPLVILAYKRTTSFFYVYYVLRTVTAMVSEGSVVCLALAYAADNVSEAQRISAFSVLTGIVSGSFVLGTLIARFLSPERTFQVAAVLSMVAAVYMRVFLRDSKPQDDDLARPILKDDEESTQSERESSGKPLAHKKVASLKHLMHLIKSSTTFSLAAFVAFFISLADGGLQSSLMYFLKARFHFGKNQFADIMLIVGVSGTISQLLLMPMLAAIIGENKLLSIGLLAGVSTILLDSIAWAAWIPYAVAVLTMFATFSTPCLRSIVSKQVGPTEQGMAQGCISGISSFANIIAPLIFSPLTALFLSEGAPFHFPGFSIFCLGLTSFIAFIWSIMIRVPPISSSTVSNSNCILA